MATNGGFRVVLTKYVMLMDTLYPQNDGFHKDFQAPLSMVDELRLQSTNGHKINASLGGAEHLGGDEMEMKNKMVGDAPRKKNR